MPRSLPSIVLFISIAGCSGSASYRGDGKLVDRGISTAHERYVLDLGVVDLGSQSRREYKLAGLPGEEFTVGIRTQSTRTPDGKSLYDAKPLRAKVKLELMSETSGKVFAIDDDLRSWAWNEARDLYVFLYGRGDKQQPSSTSFRPKPGESYRLALEVLTPDPGASQYGFSLLAVGGGWK
jgi:hypothetical protein